jgi:hypothetical protein
MKKIVYLFIVISSVISMSCSSEDISNEPNVVTAVSNSMSDEDVTYLISYINETAVQYHSYIVNDDSRGLRSFFKWLVQVIYLDACGYSWGLENGLGLRASLIPAVACSAFGAVQMTKEENMTFLDWTLNAKWNVFPSNLDFQKIGYDHNKAIYDMYRNNPNLFNLSGSSILTQSISTLKNMGYTSSLSQMQYNILILSIQQSYDFFVSGVESSLANTPYSSFLPIVKSYADNVVNITDSSEIVSYTNSIFSQIDSMGILKAKELKAAISVCANSRMLWKER